MVHRILLATVLCTGVTVVISAPVIDAPWGRVAGKDLTLASTAAPFYGYLGIPFALPPVGERRFAKPQRHPGPGTGRVFNASKMGFVCPQNTKQLQSEDCLTLNVYTPASNAGALKAVMIWIHGGGYTAGDATIYTPGQLVTEGDVIVVVIQYRLGILGFLSTDDSLAPGNYGLWDQHMAIKWVKDNIRAFGGDPESITIFGESAGGSAVGYQVLSPYSRGLFGRAILQSGTPFTSWSINKEPRKALYFLARNVDCLRENEEKPPQWMLWYAQYMSTQYLNQWTSELHRRIMTCLRGVNFERMLPFTTAPFDGMEGFLEETLFVPSVDGDFVPRDPAQLILDPDYLAANGVTSRDVMIGLNNNEGKVLTGFPGVFEPPPEFIAQLQTQQYVDFFIGYELDFLYGEQLAGNEDVLSALTDVVDFFYTQPRQNGIIALQAVADIFIDAYYAVPGIWMARGLTKAAARAKERNPQSIVGRTFFYLFDHYPVWAEDDLLRGTNHGEDLAYLFDPVSSLVTQFRDEFTGEDFILSNNFVALWTDFAKTGNPSTTLSSQLNGAVWPEFTTTDEAYLAIAPQPRVERDLYARRSRLWLDLVPTLLNYTRGQDAMTQNMWTSQASDWHGNRMNMQRMVNLQWYYTYYWKMMSCL